MRKYTQLTTPNRQSIEILLSNKLSISDIAKRLGCHRSTIYREIQRNSVENTYKYHIAQDNAKTRRHQKRGFKLDKNKQLHDEVIGYLINNHYSPERIAGRMREQNRPYSICHETIYQYIYKNKALKLYQYLASQQSHRFRHFSRKKQRRANIEPRLITHRPKEIDDRQTPGHWEADSVIFADTRKKAVITLVERVSRAIILRKVNSRSTEETIGKIIDAFKKLPAEARQTATADQGGEFADYRSLERILSCKLYYCNVGAPWEKGTNENTNGILRRYLPRSFNTDDLTQDLLDAIAREMNNTPRKCLGYKTPKEIFCKHFKNCNSALN